MKSKFLFSLLAGLLCSEVHAQINAMELNNQILRNTLVINQQKKLNQENKDISTDIDPNSVTVNTIPSYYVDEDNRIEIKERWSRYCIEGIQYLSSDEHYRTFTTLVDKEGKPLQCIAVFKDSK